jgi:hypothetical protein
VLSDAIFLVFFGGKDRLGRQKRVVSNQQNAGVGENTHPGLFDRVDLN